MKLVHILTRPWLQARSKLIQLAGVNVNKKRNMSALV